MGYPDDCCLVDAGVGHNGRLQVNRRNPLTAALHHVLGPVDNLYVPLRVHGYHIPGMVPAIDEGLGRAGVVQVFAGNPRTSHQQLALMFAVPREVCTLLVHHPDVEARYGQPLLDPDVHLRIVVPVVHVTLVVADGDQRGSLGHTIGVGHGYAQLIEGPEHVGRNGGAPADQQDERY